MAPPAFVHRRSIRFSHCDPGGIVYFPHYFEMVYEAVEDWFDTVIEPNLETRLREQGSGFPTINTKCDFFRPSRVGDVMAFDSKGGTKVTSSGMPMGSAAGSTGASTRLVIIRGPSSSSTTAITKGGSKPGVGWWLTTKL